MTYAEWVAEGERRFGTDRLRWRFVCPSCGHVAAVQDWKDAKAPEGSVAFACVGRWAPGLTIKSTADAAFKGKGGPCNYTGGGLFRLNPVPVTDLEGKEFNLFAFAEGEPA